MVASGKRTFCRWISFGLASLSVLFVVVSGTMAKGAETIALGSRLELFVDDYLVDRVEGNVDWRLHQPEAQEVILVTDAPWEGNTCAYYTIFADDDRYRMYYRGSHYDTETQKAAHPEVVCYAESRDGIHWKKPELGIVSYEGSTQNNIVWDGIGSHCFTVFKDTNPECDESLRYKAISRGRPQAEKGLYVFGSSDGLHWRLLRDGPVIVDGDFDSQNLAFWDSVRGKYVAYHRKSRDGKRDIMTATSDDYLHWTEPVFLNYAGAPKEHLYTNAVLAYERAPHIYIGHPTRFLPESQQVAPTLMVSRDGLNFRRWETPLIPITAPADRDGNRSNYMTWGMLTLPGAEDEVSVFATEAYYTGPDSRVRRFTYRVDGFVSLSAGSEGAAVTSKPLTFTGSSLALNCETEANGQIRVAVLDENGTAIPGFDVSDCEPIKGDHVQATVTWKNGEVERLAGRPVRLRIELENADLYSMQFVKLPR